MEQYRHIGAYGILKQKGELLLVRKSRGAYIGRLDLPGGGIEFGEDPVEALHREFLEETGLEIVVGSLLGVLSNRVRYQFPSGEWEDLHHLGVIYSVSSTDESELRVDPDGEDSDGALWVDEDAVALDTLTPFAQRAIELTTSRA